MNVSVWWLVVVFIVAFNLGIVAFGLLRSASTYSPADDLSGADPDHDDTVIRILG